MICHLPDNILHSHGKYILTSAPPRAKSWFQQVRDLCSEYGLPAPLQLLNSPLSKEQFKNESKNKVAKYWHAKLVSEISELKSLKYFQPELYSLTSPHYMWSSAASNAFECSKSTILARMASGRYRTEMLARHWSTNKSGNCRAPCCPDIPGTLEHLLAACTALAQTRERLFQMWLDKSVMYPSLHATIRSVLISSEAVLTQFVLEPLAFPLVLADFKSHGEHFAQQLSFMTRTFAFYMHNDYQKLLKRLNDPNINDDSINMFPISAPRCDVTTHCSPALASITQDGVTVPQPGLSHSVPEYVASVQCDPVTDGTTHAALQFATKTSAVLQENANNRVGRVRANSQKDVFLIQHKLLRLSEHGELADPELHDVLGCGGVGGGG